MHGSHTADALASVGYSHPLQYSLQACQTAWLMMSPTGSLSFFFFSHLVSAATLSVTVWLSCDWWLLLGAYF